MLSQTKMQLWYPIQVVDARAGPGIKSISKFKTKVIKNEEAMKIKNKHFRREFFPTDRSDLNEEAEMVEVGFLCEDGPSRDSSRTNSPRESDCEENVTIGSLKYKDQMSRREVFSGISDFINMEYWKR